MWFSPLYPSSHSHTHNLYWISYYGQPVAYNSYLVVYVFLGLSNQKLQIERGPSLQIESGPKNKSQKEPSKKTIVKPKRVQLKEDHKQIYLNRSTHLENVGQLKKHQNKRHPIYSKQHHSTKIKAGSERNQVPKKIRLMLEFKLMIYTHQSSNVQLLWDQ